MVFRAKCDQSARRRWLTHRPRHALQDLQAGICIQSDVLLRIVRERTATLLAREHAIARSSVSCHCSPRTATKSATPSGRHGQHLRLTRTQSLCALQPATGGVLIPASSGAEPASRRCEDVHATDARIESARPILPRCAVRRLLLHCKRCRATRLKARGDRASVAASRLLNRGRARPRPPARAR
jgi:hypothetical protein